jgi:uncharacterized protein YndB with AHSA1/START domain
MPRQKDLKRLVRSRMKKTGEAYTAARLQLLNKVPDYSAAAGMSDEVVQKKTGRTWADWVRVLDGAKAAEKPHREIAQYVSSLGTPDWWSQMVTVGYERIRGLRDRGQRRGGSYEAGKSRTFNVPVETLYDAFANTRTRKKWLSEKFTVRTTIPSKSMRVTWEDGTNVEIFFLPKGVSRTTVAVTHKKLPDREAVETAKTAWAGRLDRLSEVLS